MKYSKPIIIAEIGGTHIGDMDRAKKLIKLAKSSGANVVKTQKRNPKECVPINLQNKPHPNQCFSYGKTYLEHREKLELSIEQHAELKKFCEEEIGIIYSSSVWDITSTKEIVSLKPSIIKIPSACNHRFDMIDYLYKNSQSQIHISLGMTTAEERRKLIYYILDKDKTDCERTVLYHCTSGYPVPFEKLYLKEIENLNNKFAYYQLPEQTEYQKYKFQVGFSNHGLGIAADMVAYTLGASYIECHFIDTRIFPHTDSAASLEPQGLEKLVRDLNAIYKALQSKPEGLDAIEKEQRDKLRQSTT